MDKDVYSEKHHAAGIMLKHERERKWYWIGYKLGLKRNFEGVEPADPEHLGDLWLNDIDEEDYKKSQYHNGYRDGFFFGNTRIKIPMCPSCGKPLFYDGCILSHKYAIFACHCGSATEYTLLTGEWSLSA